MDARDRRSQPSLLTPDRCCHRIRPWLSNLLLSHPTYMRLMSLPEHNPCQQVFPRGDIQSMTPGWSPIRFPNHNSATGFYNWSVCETKPHVSWKEKSDDY